jgi:hypothetical protein
MANFLNTFSVVLSITLLPGIMMGIIGTCLISNKIKVMSWSGKKNNGIPILSTSAS